jgi:hypothetical protein
MFAQPSVDQKTVNVAQQSARDEKVCPYKTRELASIVLTFIEAVNGIELYAYQKLLAYRIVESLLLNDGACVTALYSRQSGKSETLASTAIGLCILLPVLAAVWPNDERLSLFRDGIYIGVFAPKLDLSKPIYDKIRERAESDRCQEIMADPEIAVALVQSRGDSLAMTNGSRVSARTASEQTLVEGDTLHLVLIDEAQRVSRAKVNKEISPMLAARNGSMVKIGTAWMSKGGFHTDIAYNIEAHKNSGPRNHFQFDYAQVISEKRALYSKQKREYEKGLRDRPADPFHLKYEKYIAAELARMGGNKDSEEFKMNFRLLWMESRTIAIQEALFTDLACSALEMNEPRHTGFLYGGLDVAKVNDSTLLTIVEVDIDHPIPAHASGRTSAEAAHNIVYYYNKRIIAWLKLQGSFEGSQYQSVVEFLRGYRLRKLLVDSTGMGDPVCERLQVLLAGYDDMLVEPFRYTTQSKSDLYKYYLDELVARRLTYAAGERTVNSVEYQEFREQHINLEREWRGSYLVCQAPDGEHDDYPDSGALAVWASRDVHEIADASGTVKSIPYVEIVQTYRSSARNMLGNGEHSRAERYLHGRRA